MLQEESQQPIRSATIKCDQPQNNANLQNKGERCCKDCQISFEKNYPKNIFIPMIEYLAELGLKEEYENSVGSREDLEGKNVVSLGLIHRVMGASWFKSHVTKSVLVSNICNKILMNSKIKKKLFHLYIVKHLFDVYDQDLREFKKRISRLASSISEQQCESDQLFHFPSATLYLLRLFYRQISNQESRQKFVTGEEGLRREETVASTIPRQSAALAPSSTLAQCIGENKLHSESSVYADDSEPEFKQGSKEEYKHYIRKIIVIFNSHSSEDLFLERFLAVSTTILKKEAELTQKYRLPLNVPSWDVFVDKVVSRCFECLGKNSKITHSMMNSWIMEFKQIITSNKKMDRAKVSADCRSYAIQKKQTPYTFRPYILKFSPSSY